MREKLKTFKKPEVRQIFNAMWRALYHFHYAAKTKLRTFKKTEVRESFKVFVESIVSFPLFVKN